MKLLVARSLLVVVAVTCSARSARADIYQWEYIDPLNPSLGKQQSSILVDSAKRSSWSKPVWEVSRQGISH